MAAVPYKVYVVVDREFREKLPDLERSVPVWIVDTPTNSPVAQRLRKERPDQNHLTGIRTFHDLKGSSPEDLLLEELDMIDLHHGSHSADPPYTIIDVLGTSLRDKAKNELAAYGFNEFNANSVGFTAIRPKPSD